MRDYLAPWTVSVDGHYGPVLGTEGVCIGPVWRSIQAQTPQRAADRFLQHSPSSCETQRLLCLHMLACCYQELAHASWILSGWAIVVSVEWPVIRRHVWCVNLPDVVPVSCLHTWSGTSKIRTWADWWLSSLKKQNQNTRVNSANQLLFHIQPKIIFQLQPDCRLSL